MRTLGRFLQACGLVLAPMAIFYYFENRGKTAELGLGVMEWVILLTAVVIFLLGRWFEDQGRPPA